VWDELDQYPESYDALIVTTPYCTISQLVQLLRKGARLIFNGFDGNINSFHRLNLSLIHRMCITLKGVYSRPQIYMEKAVKMLKNNITDLDGIITHYFTIDNINKAFEIATVSFRFRDSIKVVIAT